MMRRKKIIIFGALAALMLLTISVVTAITTNTRTTRKESPLFKIRLTRIKNIINIITNFLQRDRIFFIPTIFLKSKTGTQEDLPPCTTSTGYLTACVSTGYCCKEDE